MMIEDLVPHRQPFLLIDKVISHQKDEIVCQVDWSNAKFFHDRSDNLLAVSMPEMIAQAAAVMYGLQAPETGAIPALRMLAAIKQFSFYALPTQNVLQVKVRVHTSLGLHQVVYGAVYEEANLLAEGMVFLFCKEPPG